MNKKRCDQCGNGSATHEYEEHEDYHILCKNINEKYEVLLDKNCCTPCMFPLFPPDFYCKDFKQRSK